MKNSRKLIICIMALFIVGSIVGSTYSWLSSTSETVVNHFAGGAISIKLDEAQVDGHGKKTDDPRVTENTYKYVAGSTLDKDPTVTVLKGSESCYVFLYVDNPLPTDLFTINYSDSWKKIGTSGTGVIYAYKKVIDTGEKDTALEPIFTQIKVSKKLTSKDVEKLGEQKITVQAYAVQSDSITQDEALTLAKDYFKEKFELSSITDTKNAITIENATIKPEDEQIQDVKEETTEDNSSDTSETDTTDEEMNTDDKANEEISTDENIDETTDE